MTKKVKRCLNMTQQFIRSDEEIMFAPVSVSQQQDYESSTGPICTVSGGGAGHEQGENFRGWCGSFSLK